MVDRQSGSYLGSSSLVGGDYPYSIISAGCEHDMPLKLPRRWRLTTRINNKQWSSIEQGTWYTYSHVWDVLFCEPGWLT